MSSSLAAVSGILLTILWAFSRVAVTEMLLLVSRRPAEPDVDHSQIWIRGDVGLRNETSRKYTHLTNLLDVAIAACDKGTVLFLLGIAFVTLAERKGTSVVSKNAAKAIQAWLQHFCDMCFGYLAVGDRQLFAAAHALPPTQNGIKHQVTW